MCFGRQEQQPIVYYIPETPSPYYTLTGSPEEIEGAVSLLSGRQESGNFVPTNPWEGQTYNYIPGAMQLLRMRQSPQYLW